MGSESIRDDLPMFGRDFRSLTFSFPTILIWNICIIYIGMGENQNPDYHQRFIEFHSVTKDEIDGFCMWRGELLFPNRYADENHELFSSVHHIDERWYVHPFCART